MTEVQLVIFKLGSEEYGVDIMQVKEIGPYKQAVRIPNTPSFIEGVINLRGEIIPIVSLKKRFSIEIEQITDQTRIIVVNVNEKQIGFIVDDASEVLTITSDQIDPAPTIVAGVDREYISGIGKLEERILIILDLNKLFSEKEKQVLSQINENNEEAKEVEESKENE